MSGVLLTVAFYAILRFKAICDLSVGAAVRTHAARDRGLALARRGGVAAADPTRLQAHARVLTASSTWGSSPWAPPPASRSPSPPSCCTSSATAWPRASCSSPPARSWRPKAPARSTGCGPCWPGVPPSAGVFGVGLLALLGFPPFSLFASELAMFRAEFQVGLGWAAVAAMVAMVVIFIAVMSHARHMLLGPGESSRSRSDAAPGARTARRGAGGVRRHRRLRLAAHQPARGGSPLGGAVIPTTVGGRRSGGSRSTAALRASWRRATCSVPPNALFADGMRLALVSGHDDGAEMRAVYLFTSGPPDRRIELHVPLERARPEVPTLAGAVLSGQPFRARARRPLRHRAGGSPPTAPPRPAPALARGLASDAPRRRSRRHRSPPTGARTPSSPSRVPASTRSPSAPSTPASSNRATSASGWWGRPSCA